MGWWIEHARERFPACRNPRCTSITPPVLSPLLSVFGLEVPTYLGRGIRGSPTIQLARPDELDHFGFFVVDSST